MSTIPHTHVPTGRRCPTCRTEITAYCETPKERRLLLANPATAHLCARCVARLLVRVAVADNDIHVDDPESHKWPGHENRMASHSLAVRTHYREHPEDPNATYFPDEIFDEADANGGE